MFQLKQYVVKFVFSINRVLF